MGLKAGRHQTLTLLLYPGLGPATEIYLRGRTVVDINESVDNTACYGHRECSSLTDDGKNILCENIPQYWCCIGASKYSIYKGIFLGKLSQGTHASRNICRSAQSKMNPLRHGEPETTVPHLSSRCGSPLQYSSSSRSWHDPQYITSIQELVHVSMQVRLSDYS